RYARHPEVPSINETLPDFKRIPGWIAMFGPAGMPQGVVAKINRDLMTTLKAPEVTSAFEKQDWVAMGDTPGGLGADVTSTTEVTGIWPLKRRDGSPMYRPPRPALVKDRVRHIGQAVAVVIAESVNQGKDAAEAIDVEYAPLPAQVSTADANQPGAPQLWANCA